MEGNSNLEIERLKLERLKVYGKILTVAITVFIGTLGVALINRSFQQSQLDQQKQQQQAQLNLQKEKDAAERQQAEMKYLGDFIEFALEDNAQKRLRFAEYFSALTISEDLHNKWKAYHSLIQASVQEVKKAEIELRTAEQSGDAKQAQILAVQLTELQRHVANLNTLRLRSHIQTRSGKVTRTATLVRQALTAAGYSADYEKVFDLTKSVSNSILTNPENNDAADRVLRVLQPLGVGSFIKEIDPRLERDEVHVFLNTD